MPRIPQNLCGRAIGMLNAGMKVNNVAMNFGFSFLVIRHLWQCIPVTGHKEHPPVQLLPNCHSYVC